jgi:hypothetical protein
LFFIIPRVGVGFFDKKQVSGLKVSGFSERIRLGDFGPVKKDTTVVMRVELSGGIPPGVPLYFRGQTLDHYVPTGWDATTRKKKRLWKKSNNRFVIGEVTEGGSSMLVQKIMLEPLETDVIFGASRVLMIEGRFPTLWTNESGGVYLPNNANSRIEYTAVSSINTNFKENVNHEIDYLSTDGLSSEVINLAKDITAGSKTKMEAALKIRDFLLKGYAYTLSPGRGKGASALDDFLFFTKEGYCEHFATAMAMLLRGAGVPTRIVTGFLQGEWNDYGSYLLVRQQDAHSWVEADIDGYWTRFDPTPSAGLTGLVKTSTFSMYVDSLRFKWRRYIIKYSLSDQVKVAIKVERQTNMVIKGVHSYIDAIKDIITKGDTTSLRALVQSRTFKIIFTTILFIAILLYLRFIRRTGAKGESMKKTPSFYRRMESYLRKAGLERKSEETAMEFAQRVKNKDVLGITKAFEVVRYGHAKLTDGEIENIEEALVKLKTVKVMESG